MAIHHEGSFRSAGLIYWCICHFFKGNIFSCDKDFISNDSIIRYMYR